MLGIYCICTSMYKSVSYSSAKNLLPPSLIYNGPAETSFLQYMYDVAGGGEFGLSSFLANLKFRGKDSNLAREVCAGTNLYK